MIPIPSNSASPTTTRIPADMTDSCVKCGLCLPQCPTYNLTHDEAESPRGRIGLMQALAVSSNRPSDRVATHLENCLACRRCEAVCPAHVPYGRLIDAARAELLLRGHKLSLSERLLLAVARRDGLRDVLAVCLRTTVALKLPSVLRPVVPRKFRRLIDLLPEQLPALRQPAIATTRATPRGRVALFTGCMGELLDTIVLQDHLRVLGAAGFDVVVPDRQRCCGALALHAGDTDTAAALMHDNTEVFAAVDCDAIVVTATGCGATLQEYDVLAQAPGFAGKVHDAAWLLAQTDWQPPGAAAGCTIAVHEPCTQLNVIGEHDATMQILRRIKGARLITLPGNDTCCGAAGAQLLNNPDYAERLIAPKVSAIGELRPDYIVSANIGCAMHLRSALRRTTSDAAVMHPISLIARLLDRST